jgi:hypothetical protein
MNLHDAFDSACRKRGLGKRLDIENYPHVPAAPVYAHTRELAVELIESVLEHFPAASPIHFDFIEEPNVNAYAFKEDDNYFIGINAGAVLMLHLVIDHIFASNQTFPSIGDVQTERDRLPVVNWSNVNAADLFYEGIRPIGAFSDARVMLGKVIADQALMFLVGHEIAHITRGHVDFLSDEMGVDYVSEKPKQESTDDRLVRQAIEADADRRSIHARCYSMHLTAARNATTAPVWSESPSTEQEYQYYSLFATNVIFRLFGDRQFNFDDLDGQWYPPLAIRRRMAMDYAADLMRSNWPPNSDGLISEAVLGSVKACEASFAAIGAEAAGGGFAQAFTSESAEHIRKIGRTYQHIKPRLQTFAVESLTRDDQIDGQQSDGSGVADSPFWNR